ncbi:DNA topoisomerase (ATP-hydrolyzing) [Malassezia vespertilionis]|uniref:DNA topoisomerase 2 n=1 Tax=Malassezia vespertilionis TaxID=2020962 RepID=A0A2N1J8L2_9BASI|nr:DNA topoisomerase (ATP-hydrolyzing) [Malassezia vespertilionis]PKI82895.1 Top2p [Malassezia vespertilionis]WFD08278.1 DNA topoisomerase (ATP-hydrolyzing) [Malassezia vespertilionis]
MSAQEDGAMPPSTKASSTSKTASETYQKLSQLEHVLRRPDTYIGSVEKRTEQMWVFDSEKQQMVYRDTTYVPGFYKIFDEILVNAADNKVRDSSMDTLKVTIDKEAGSVSVWNNGQGIPIEVHEKEQIYIPELIFGNLLTSSNYDDDEAKVTGGRNGFGAKLTNIYSSEFTVETADRERELKYKQTFKEHMHAKEKPKILKNSRKEEFTCITFKPDLALFHMDSIDADTEALLMKRVYDMAGTVKGVKVYLNGERLKVKNFKQYFEMYVSAIQEISGVPKAEDENGAPQPKPTVVFDSSEHSGRTWEVGFAVSDGTARQVSFVNNIATIKGGKHVEHVESQIVNRILEHVNKGKKSAAVKTNQVRQQLWIFVNSQIVNPTFDSQTKETLTLKPSAFGSKWVMPDDFARKVLRSGVVDNVQSIAQYQQDRQLQNTDGRKRSRVSVTKLEDANWAGGKRSGECTLILTEGDSAKALAVSGLSEVGRDAYGVFPLRGKLLNVREATHDAIMKNAEIKNIKEILGLQHGKQYDSVDGLRYGSIMIMTDQDFDGSHIKGLIINFLDHFYPSLLRLPNFLVEFITPIVKATKGSEVKAFFTMPEYERWKESSDGGRGWSIKYYKGLGTSKAEDMKKYFRNMDTHMLSFEAMRPADRELVDLAFNKKKADDRKEWLRQFVPGTFLDHRIRTVPISDFINKELILFSMADNIRSIPSVVDGLKPGQRKVLFGCFKRNLKGEIKVQQLQGYVSEHTAYHHGDQSLVMTIVGLAQDYCGSNNVNLLMPNGQFGTRSMGGKDAASARYIFTAVPRITRTLFNQQDDALLNYLDDDGQSIEPEWYVPVVPQVLLNGAEGIGTGWSTFVPNYNPHDIVANLRRRMAGEEYVPMMPWYRGFCGTIEPVAQDRYRIAGHANQLDEVTWEITELPVRTWTMSYKEWLEERLNGSDKTPAVVREYKEYHSDTTVHFVVELNQRGVEEIAKVGPDAFFRLSSIFSTGNMVLFSPQGKIKKYASPLEMLDDFYFLRLGYYQRRKEHLVDELKHVYDRLSNQARFVSMIIDKELIVSNRKKLAIVEELRSLGFQAFPKPVAKAKSVADRAEEEPEEEAEEEAALGGSITDYDYLLGMAIYSLTKERVDRLLHERDGTEQRLKILLGRSPQNLWDEDLTNFLTEWEAKLEDDARLAAQTSIRQIAMPKRRRAPAKKPVKKEEEEGQHAKPVSPLKSAAKSELAAPSAKHTRDSDDELAMPAPKVAKAAPKVAKAAPKVAKAAPKAAPKPKAPKRAATPSDDEALPPPARRATSSRAAAKSKHTYQIDSDEEVQDDPADESVQIDDDDDDDYYR